MKNFSKIIFILLILISVFSYITPSVEAEQKVKVNNVFGEAFDLISYTAPTNNEVMIGDNIQIDFEIYYPKLTGSDLLKNANIYFYDEIDGKVFTKSIYLLNKTFQEINKMEGKTERITTNSFSLLGSKTAKKYQWYLVEKKSDGSIRGLITKSFTFKTNTNDDGYYSIIKSVGDNSYIFRVSDPYKTIELCQENVNSILNGSLYKNPEIYTACKKYDSRPATPNNVITVTGQNDTKKSTVYKLLAPIGELTTAPDNIGDYFNTMFKIAIGICAVLAVVMIVIGGIQYMGNESIFGKTEAKTQIWHAILGLLIALASFALLNTIDPNLLGGKGVSVKQVSVEIVPLYDRGISDPKKENGESVRCTPVKTGPCSVANLTPIFGAENAVAMSKICNMESSGTNATSSTDICKPGNTAFSFGLFQVNLAANGKLAGADCVGLFDKSVSGKDVIEPRYNNGYSCKLKPGKEAIYNTCKNRLLDPTKNIAIAKSLFTKDKKAWLGDKKYCASAFN